jgi:predicted Na+-dependent transporter
MLSVNKKSTERSISTRPAGLADFADRYFFTFLVGAYALAVIAPELGVTIADSALHVGPLGDLSACRVMVALILFIGTASVGQTIFAAESCGGLLTAINIASRLLALAAGVALLFRQPFVFDGGYRPILLGLALTFAMPAAFSSIGWTFKSSGSVLTSVRLVLISTLVVPTFLFVLPFVSSTRHVGLQVPAAALGQLLLLILVAVAAGRCASRILARDRFEAWKPHLRLTNLALILLLNYANASLVLPQSLAHPLATLCIPLVASLLVCLGCFAGSHWLAMRLTGDVKRATAFTYGNGMFNTGLALVVIPAVLPAVPAALLAPLVVAVVQHAVASAWDARLNHEP